MEIYCNNSEHHTVSYNLIYNNKITNEYNRNGDSTTVKVSWLNNPAWLILIYKETCIYQNDLHMIIKHIIIFAYNLKK
jgi:hypothetical protein